MKFETIEVSGWKGALWGLRLPMSKDLDDAKSKSDSFKPYCSESREYVEESCNYDACGHTCRDENNHIGKDDLRIAQNLIKADEKKNGGQPNGKFLRMIHVQVGITAPLYWWKEMDTYKIGTTANSTSTMHKLASTPITMDCFEMGDFEDVIYGECDYYTSTKELWNYTIVQLESLRQKYNETKDKRYWKELIRQLPESWLQTRMFDCDYATLRNMYYWRVKIPHKLTEWKQFGDWVESLPYAKELICS